MMRLAITFLFFALGAALIGFGGVSPTSAGLAQGLFFLFVALFVAALLTAALGDGDPPDRGRAGR